MMTIHRKGKAIYTDGKQWPHKIIDQTILEHKTEGWYFTICK